MKNSLYEINSRLDIAEEKVNDFEGILQKLSKEGNWVAGRQR